METSRSKARIGFPFQELGDDIVHNILSFLDANDLKKIDSLSRRTRELCRRAWERLNQQTTMSCYARIDLAQHFRTHRQQAILYYLAKVYRQTGVSNWK